MSSLVSTARITVDDLKEIFPSTITDIDLNSYINTAHYIIQNNLLNQGLSTDILTEIEKYLAAHLLASTREQQVSQEKVEQWSATFQGETGMGLKSTFYGQNAMMLDSTGTLAKLGAGLIQATFEVYSEYDYTWQTEFGDT